MIATRASFGSPASRREAAVPKVTGRPSFVANITSILWTTRSARAEPMLREDRGMTEFRELHKASFVMPNAWDAGSAIVLAEAGFAALATTSAGIAFSLGAGDHTLPDGAPSVPIDVMFERIQQITAAVGVPVNGDLEDGYGAAGGCREDDPDWPGRRSGRRQHRRLRRPRAVRRGSVGRADRRRAGGGRARLRPDRSHGRPATQGAHSPGGLDPPGEPVPRGRRGLPVRAGRQRPRPSARWCTRSTAR